MTSEIKAIAQSIAAHRMAFRFNGEPKHPTQSRIADELNVSQQLVGRWERTGRITMEHLCALADLYGVTVAQLVSGAAPSETPPADGNLDLAALGLALDAYEKAGLNDQPDITRQEHTRTLGMLYNLARNIMAGGTGRDDAVNILAADAEKVVMLIRLDQPSAT